MSLNATMLTEHKYWCSKLCTRTIWMDHEASTESGKRNNSMPFWPIEVQLALNWHAGFNLMAVIVGSSYFDSYMYSQKLPFLYSSIHHDVFFMHTWNWTLADSRYRLFMICHKLQVVKICGEGDLAGHRSSHWTETCILIPSLRALLMEMGSHNQFQDPGLLQPEHASYSKCS